MSTYERDFEKKSNQIIGAAIEVHRILKSGFIESIYHNALKHELSIRKIPFKTEHPVKVNYKGNLVGSHRLDLIVNDDIVVELKSVKAIADAHLAQILSYLKATSLKVGLIINFGQPKIEVKRVVNGL